MGHRGDKRGACEKSCGGCRPASSLLLSELCLRLEAPGRAARRSPALPSVPTGLGQSPSLWSGFCSQAGSGPVLFPGPWPITEDPRWVTCHSCSSVYVYLPFRALETPSYQTEACQVQTHRDHQSNSCCRLARDAFQTSHLCRPTATATPGRTECPFLLPELGGNLPFCNHHPWS